MRTSSMYSTFLINTYVNLCHPAKKNHVYIHQSKCCGFNDMKRTVLSGDAPHLLKKLASRISPLVLATRLDWFRSNFTTNIWKMDAISVAEQVSDWVSGECTWVSDQVVERMRERVNERASKVSEVHAQFPLTMRSSPCHKNCNRYKLFGKPQCQFDELASKSQKGKRCRVSFRVSFRLWTKMDYPSKRFRGKVPG